MSNIIDKRRIIARASEQEYAHQYPFEGKNEEYQYKDEDKRVKYHVKSDTDDNKTQEELYNVQPTQIIPSNNSKIRVRMNTDEILEENKQRSYKIKSVPPIWDKADPGQEAYKLQNDPREDEVNYIQESSSNFSNAIEEESKLPLNTPAGRTQTFKEATDTEEEIAFDVGMKVEHVEEGIKGEVKFVGATKIAIVWEDNTRERFDIAEAKKCLKKSSISPTQQQVDPLHSPLYPKNEEVSPVVQQALQAIEAIEDNEDDKTASKIDIEKVKLQRKVNDLQNQIDAKEIEKIKIKAANELVELMQKKSMIKSEEEAKSQFDNIMKMDDIGFEAFKNVVLSTNTSSELQKNESEVDDILSVLDEDDYSDIEDGQEYAKAKEAMKKATTSKRTVDGIEMGDTSFFENGGLKHFKPVIGGFGDSSIDPQRVETRSISSSEKRPKGIERKAGNGLDLSSFEGIQGIKTPINIPSKETTVLSKYTDLFNSLNWTTISKY